MPKTDKESIDQRPLHERIATDLRRQILAGERVPGSSLPTTSDLKAQFKASNATIQKALGMLKAEGLVVGRPGSAVRVREHRRWTIRPAASSSPAEPGQRYRWLAEAERQGRRAQIRLLQVGEVRPPVDVRTALGLGEEGVAVLRAQLLTLDDEPAELAKNYYPVELARGTALAEHRKIKGGSPTLLAEMGYPPRRTVDRVTAEEATQEEFEALEMPSPLPVLHTFRIVYSDGDRPIEVTTMAKAGHLYEVQYEF